ncbi:MAG: hypothetical protein AB7R89_16020 [Dehalococcoidia bacterium]
MAIPTKKRRTAFLEAFYERVKSVPHFHAMRVEEDTYPLAITTEIWAPLLDRSSRDLIYNAELQTLDEFPTIRARFTVLNPREIA